MNFTQDEYCDEIFENLNIRNEILKSKEFDNCTFKNCKFNETTFQFCRLTESIFEDCDLSLIRIKDSVFNDVNIVNSKAIGINWSLCGQPYSMNFTNSNISMSSFSQVDLRHSNIISCIAHEVDFYKTNLEKANFANTDLLNATFGDTNLKNTDLTSAINYMINPNMNNINQTKVALPEAVSFLKFFDLKIQNKF